MAKIYIDNIEFDVDGSKNLLDACISLGLDLPYFCWHPEMGSVGACRQCAVVKFRDEKDERGRITMACMEPAADGTRISLKSKEAVAMRAGVIEWLMTNHPHDCPVCDEGGECHLQDMTLMSGHNYRRHRYKKRTYVNQYLGPFINHEMNRCIQCYRCVRFYRDYSGGDDFNVFAIHNIVYFGRHEEGVLKNEFSGNLVEVCPTGVFTDKTLKKHYTRKWDLTNAPSICHHCSVGCNIIASERYGTLRRILTRYNGEVNGYFLCDRGRFGYEFVNHPKRIKNVYLKENGSFKLSDSVESIAELKNIFNGRERVIGIGSPRASLEANFALMKFVGKENFYHGISKKQKELTSHCINILRSIPVRTPSLREIEKKDAVLILGEDLTNSAPMMALAVMQAARQKPMRLVDQLNIPRWNDAAVRELIQKETGPVFIAAPAPTKLDKIALANFRMVPDDIARFGFALANFLNADSPGVNIQNERLPNLVKVISEELLNAENPLIISGTSSGSKAVIEAAANIASALQMAGKNVSLSFVVPECNSFGLEMLGGKDLNDAAEEINRNTIHSAIVIENDLSERITDNVFSSFKKLKNLISFDYLENKTTEAANIIFPVGAFAETDGTLVNNEGRAQRYYQVYPVLNPIKETWRWIRDIAVEIGNSEFKKFYTLIDFTNQIVSEMPEFSGIETLTPPPDFRIAGQKIPRQTHRYSGRTSNYANINIHEQKPVEDIDSPLSFSMEGYMGEPPSSIIPFFWKPGWNSQQAINKYQIEVGGPLHDGDPGKRLIEPSQKSMYFFSGIPESFNKREDELLIIPLFQIFGSDQLSSHSAPVQERIPLPYLLLNEDDIKKYNLKENSEINLTISERNFKLKIIKGDMPPGAGGISVLSGMGFVELPAYAKINGVNT